MKKLYILILLVVSGSVLFGQQDIMFTQYMNNGLIVNPAYAGRHDFLSTVLIGRFQWVGLDGAPTTQTFSIHGPLKNRTSALGLTISNDHIGVTNQTDVHFNYAYHIRFKGSNTLSLGIKGGTSFYHVNTPQLVKWDDNDDVYSDGGVLNVLPNAGAGIQFYNDYMYLGFSVPDLISYDPDEVFSVGANVNEISNSRRHYYFTGGLAIPFADKAVILKPGFLFKFLPNAPFQADINLSALLKERVWIGASYRTTDAVALMASVLIGKGFRIGYSYDFTISELRRVSSGSHEIMLGLDIGKKVLSMKSPRYF